MKKLLSLITLFTLGAFSALTSWGAEVTLTDANTLNAILANPGNYAGNGNTYKPSKTLTGSWLKLGTKTTLRVLEDHTFSLGFTGTSLGTSCPTITSSATIPGGTKVDCDTALYSANDFTVSGGG